MTDRVGAPRRPSRAPMVVARVRRTLVDRGLIPAQSRVLCACSGGPDSASLLFALVRLGPTLGFEVSAASVDHGLRPEAQRDIAIAAGQAAQLSVPFRALSVRVDAGASLQARAREARYAALGRLAEELGASRIAVGHTRDDQAETVLARLLRGAGVRGLAAIEPLRADGVIRPLLDCERSEVHRLARAQFSELADDASNYDPRFERVRIRAHVLPALCAEDPALVRHMAELADEARDVEYVLDELATSLLGRARLDSETLDISVLRPAAPLLRRAALRRWLEPVFGGHLGRAELLLLDRTLRSGRGEVWISAAHSVRAEGRARLRLCPRA